MNQRTNIDEKKSVSLHIASISHYFQHTIVTVAQSASLTQSADHPQHFPKSRSTAKCTPCTYWMQKATKSTDHTICRFQLRRCMQTCCDCSTYCHSSLHGGDNNVPHTTLSELQHLTVNRARMLLPKAVTTHSIVWRHCSCESGRMV